VPSRGGEVPRQLRPLTRKALRAFIQVERPGGEIDNAYARCVATLKEPQYPPDLYELAVNIDSDGNDHFGRFRDIQRVFGAYDGAAEPYLRNVVLGTKEQTKAALDLYDATLAHLGRAYSAEAKSDYAAAQAAIDGARDNMHALEREAERLAKQGIGIPFWSE
jgi:hypothetical protein